MKIRNLLALFAFAGLGSALAMTLAYENDFEAYEDGTDVRKPTGDAVAYMEGSTYTNLMHCVAEDGSGVAESKGLHSYLLKEEGKSFAGGAQYDLGLASTLFDSNCEIVYQIDWKAASNLASIDITDGKSLFFRLYSNGATARRVGATNSVTRAKVELVGESGDPATVPAANSWSTYRIHVLFPEGRISMIERIIGSVTNSYPQTSLYGIGKVKPTHFGAGIMGSKYSPNNRNCYTDNLKVTYEVISTPKMSVSGITFVQVLSNDPTVDISNIGTGNFAATVEVVEGSGFFAFEEDKESKGSFQVSVTNTVTLHTAINKEVLGKEFGRAKVKFSGAGSETYLDYTIQSGSPEEGYMLYSSDFENVSLGNILEVDPSWVKSGTVENCDVVSSSEGGQCLKIGTAKALHLNCSVPKNLSGDYDVRVAMKLKFPSDATLSDVTWGTDLSHRMGEYRLRHDSSSGNIYVTLESCENKNAITNRVDYNEWFNFSYTYNSSVSNRILRAFQFGDFDYSLALPVTAECAADNFMQIRNYSWTSDTCYYIDDFELSLEPRGQGVPPKMEVASEYGSLPYDKDAMYVKVSNLGGGQFDYTAEIKEGQDYLKLDKTSGTVKIQDALKLTVDRKKLGVDFYKGAVLFTSKTEGVAPYLLKFYIQSGNKEDGWVIYASDFDSFDLTQETEEGLVGELSEQDACWLKTDAQNRCDVVIDPENSENQCMKLVDCRYNSRGYHLALNISSNLVDNYDVAYSMKFRIPKSYVDGPEGTALLCVSQEDSSRKCEVNLYLNEEDGNLPVETGFNDLEDTEWWSRERETAVPVESESWFNFYMRFNCKLIDYDHKELHAFTFGDNEYKFDEETGRLTYPGGIKEAVLYTESLSKLKFWSYKYKADILVDDIKISLVPKDIPEPALLGLLGLALLLIRRK